MEFLHKNENLFGIGHTQVNTIDPRGGIQFMDCEGDEQVWVTDCDNLTDIYNDITKMIAEKRNMSIEDATETFDAITVDFAFCGYPVDEFDDTLTPNDFTKKVTKAEYVKEFYEIIELILDLPEYQ